LLGGGMCEYVSPDDVQIVSMSAVLTTEGSTVSINWRLFVAYSVGTQRALCQCNINSKPEANCILFKAPQNWTTF